MPEIKKTLVDFKDAHDLFQVSDFQSLKDTPHQARIQSIRRYMKRMGDLSGVPIEPAQQTKLLNACIERAGVIGGGVPGGKQEI
jgi:phosphomevalonate kinase